MIATPLTEDSLRVAISRIQDFATIHSGQSDQGEALTILRESLGITDEILRMFTEWAETFLEDDSVGAPIIIGLMMGLIASDHAQS